MYHLLAIDLIDTYIHADVFDEDHYTTIASSESIEVLIPRAVIEFLDRNTWLGKEFTYEQWEAGAENYGTEVVIMDDTGHEFLRSSMLGLDGGVMLALRLALTKHGGRKRKGDNTEEMTHLLDISHLLYRKGERRGLVISAALCHDLLEDTSCTAEELREAMGDSVLAVVQSVTNDLTLDKSEQWETKKLEYIKSVEAGGEFAQLVSLADKIVNLQALKRAYEQQGPIVWKNFNRGKEKKLWFEESVYAMLAKNLENALLKQYRKLIDEMKEMKDG